MITRLFVSSLVTIVVLWFMLAVVVLIRRPSRDTLKDLAA